MWQRWSKVLEALGRMRTRAGGRRKAVVVGHPGAPDAKGSREWRDHAAPEPLYDVWGPVPGSPWEPYHCVPLFAALDRIPPEGIGPAVDEPAGSEVEPPLPDHLRVGAPYPDWLTRESWTIVDLPGARAVEVGVWLIAAGCQPVCTFDNWPHAAGVLKPERTLAQLLRWASTVADLRQALDASSPPLWICDAERLGEAPGKPGEFDNRYFLDDSILPGPGILREAGIQRVVYLDGPVAEGPVLDLEGYFADLLSAGVEVLRVEAEDPGLDAVPFATPRTPRRRSPGGYRRSSAGGFGTEIPKPSTGSSG